MPVYELLINQVPVTLTAKDAFNITAPQNGAATLDVTLCADSVGGLFATFDMEIVLTEDGEPLFGGNITRPRLTGIGGKGTTAVEMSITASDFNALASRRYIGATSANLPAGTLKQALQAIVPWIPAVTLAPDQVDGPTIEAFNPNPWKAQAALDYLTQATGFIWRVEFVLSPVVFDPGTPWITRYLRMFEPGSITAPYDINQVNTDVVLGSTALGVPIDDVSVEPKRDDDYANRVFVQVGSALAMAEDAAAILAHGDWELLVQAPDGTTADAAQALANSLLAEKLVVQKEIQYSVLTRGLAPGQSQSILLPARGVNNVFLLTEQSTSYAGGIARRTVTALEGSVYKPQWREKTRAMFSGGGTTFAGGGTTTTTGGGGGSSVTRYAYPLGGSAVDFLSSPIPTWVNAGGAVQVSTVARGNSIASVVAELRAYTTGVSVRARLFDETDGVALTGMSPLVVNTDWQLVTWTVTLHSGAHLVRLQLLPGTADEGVAVNAVAYLE